MRLVGAVAQLAEAHDLKSCKCGFESHRRYFAWPQGCAPAVMVLGDHRGKPVQPIFSANPARKIVSQHE